MALSKEADEQLLGRPPKFDGADAQRPDRAFQLRAYAETMDDHMGAQLDTIEAAPDRVLTMAVLSAEAQSNSNSRRLHYVLAAFRRPAPTAEEVRAWQWVRVLAADGLALLRIQHEFAAASPAWLHHEAGAFPDGGVSF